MSRVMKWSSDGMKAGNPSNGYRRSCCELWRIGSEWDVDERDWLVVVPDCTYVFDDEAEENVGLEPVRPS